jgi:hypothetical protein
MKKRFNLILFVLLILGSMVRAQTGCQNFEKYYDFSYEQQDFDVDFISSGGYIIYGGQASDTLGTVNYQTHIHRLEANGDTIWTRTMGGDDPTNFYGKFGLFPGIWFRQGALLQDSIIIACGAYQDSSCQEYFHYYGRVVRYTMQGDTVWTRLLALPDTTVGMYGMMVYDDSTVIIAGDYKPLYGPGNPISKNKTAIIKYNINGQLIWRKALPVFSKGYGYKMSKAINGDILLAGAVFKSNQYDPTVARLDSNGNVLWVDSIGNTYDEYATKAISKFDNSVIVIGNRSVIANNSQFTSTIKKYSATGSLLWIKNYTYGKYSGFLDGMELPGGGIVIAGANGDSTGNIMGYLLRTDSNGDSLWSRSFGSDTTYKYFHCIAQTCEGYVMAGISFLPNNLQYLPRTLGWVIHTDTLGFVTTGIEDFMSDLSLSRIDLPYPNPAKYSTQIKLFVPDLPSNMYTQEDKSYLYIFNILGKQLEKVELQRGEQNLTLNVSAFPSGSYVLVMSVNGYNACTRKLMVVK